MFDAYQENLDYVDELTPSQRRKIHNANVFNVTFGCAFSITSRKFTDFRLSDNWEELLELIPDLHINGMPNRGVPDFLNSNNYEPRRSDKLSTKLVWSLIEKYKIRLRKQNEVKIRGELGDKPEELKRYED